MSVLAEFSMSPMDQGESVSKYVSQSLEIIADSGLPYRLGPMGTCLEGEWDAVMGVIRQCYLRMAQDCGRITCSIKVDARAGQEGRLPCQDNAERHPRPPRPVTVARRWRHPCPNGSPPSVTRGPGRAEAEASPRASR